MPFAELEEGTIHYRFDGPFNAPVLMFSNALGMDLSMWDRQVAVLSKRFKILRYDSRGHGRSLLTPGPYSIELLARDAVSLLQNLRIPSVHFCGLSMGGMVGMWLAANEPSRIGWLVLANTSAQMRPPEIWRSRIAAVRQGGMSRVADHVIRQLFTPGFIEKFPAEARAIREQLLLCPADGFMACCAAIRDMNQSSLLSSIRSPTLVIAGARDPAAPPATCRSIVDLMEVAEYKELHSAHLSNIEAADAFNAALLEFLIA